MDVLGWFDLPKRGKAVAPTHDPGINGLCAICRMQLSEPIRCAGISNQGDSRSYFFRMHFSCFKSTDKKELKAISEELTNSFLRITFKLDLQDGYAPGFVSHWMGLKAFDIGDSVFCGDGTGVVVRLYHDAHDWVEIKLDSGENVTWKARAVTYHPDTAKWTDRQRNEFIWRYGVSYD